MHMGSQIHATLNEYAGILLEHIPAGVALFDARDFCLLAANQRFYHFIQTHLDASRESDTLIGHPLAEWLPAADAAEAAALVALFRTVSETGLPYQAEEYAVRLPNRNLVYWNWSLHPVPDEQGHTIHLALYGRDMTASVLARHQVEEAHVSLTRLHATTVAARQQLEVIETVARSARASLDTRSIGQAAVDAISASLQPLRLSLHVADPRQQALRLLCLSSTQARDAGLPSLEYIPYDSPLIAAQARKGYDPILVENVQDVVASGMLPGDLPLLTPDMRGFICIPLWLKDHFEGTLSASFPEPVHPHGPEVQTLLGCSPHLTAALAHARLHAAVEDERARLRAILDQLPEGILLVEAADGTINYANAAAAAILGLPLHDLVGTTFHQHAQGNAHDDTPSRHALPWNFVVIRALCGETASGQETVVWQPDGSTLSILSSSAPLRNQEGVITGALLVFQDITAQKRLEHEKNAFLSLASHELRTPITAIMGFAEILQLSAEQEQRLNPASQRALLAQIVAQSDHLTRLIEEMFDLTRLENAQLSLHCDWHDLLAMLNEVIASQNITAHGQSIQLVVQGCAATEPVRGYFDEQRIRQIMNNLISNAVKYSPTGSSIEVGLQCTSESPEEALLWVRDHGIGIPAHELPLIFERFHRASNLDQAMSGLGLGLYLVKELVARHAGRVWVESVEGQGSIFYVLLPLQRKA